MRPQPIAPNYNAFPTELRTRPIWLLWQYRLNKESRWTKVPLVADGSDRFASTKDPQTWRSFEAAMKFAARADGAGIRIPEPYCGVDLDKCRDKATGAIAPWAQKLVERFDSYTEVSPSGEGLHIILELTAPLPEGRRERGGKDQGWEIGLYDKTSPRYFCVTGQIFDGRGVIATADPGDFYAEFDGGAWDVTKSRPNGKSNGKGFIYDKKESLLRGEWEGLYPSQSEADAGLVWYLAQEYSDDPAAIDREFRKSGLMRPKWEKRSGNGTYGSRTIANCLRKKSEPGRHPGLAEDDLALRFASLYEKDLRHVFLWNQWLRYTGVWAQDAVLKVFERSRELTREACLGAKQESVIKWLKSASTVAAVERMARCDSRLAALPDQFDTSPWLFNTTSRTVHLETGESREQRAGDYITKIAAVDPTGESGECPLWLRFLDRITAGDIDLQAYLQRVAGYCLTGEIREHVMFFLYGSGANGKGTFTQTLLGIWNDYAQTASIETFTECKTERHPTDLAAMRAARLIVVSETEVGKHWAESRIKSLTGGDPVRARFMRSDEFEYVPAFKLMIQGNHKPSLRSVNEAIRRRLHLVPFTVTIPREERDLELTKKLKQEWPAILRWAVDGCLAWQREGLKPPAPVREATEEYLANEDAMGRWMDECCLISPQAGSTRASVLYQNFREWCERTGEYVPSQKRFSQEIANKGFKKYESTGMRYQGVALREQDAGVPRK